jgi:hypothetical protein
VGEPILSRAWGGNAMLRNPNPNPNTTSVSSGVAKVRWSKMAKRPLTRLLSIGVSGFELLNSARARVFKGYPKG